MAIASYAPHPMLGLVALLLMAGLLVACAAVVATWWSLTHPPRRTYASALARGRPGDPSELPVSRAFTSWRFTHDRESLAVWDIPGDDPLGPIVLMLHGWGDSRLGALSRLPAVLPVASRVLAIDLPGHGESSGQSSVGHREAEAVEAIVDSLARESEEADHRRAGLAGLADGASPPATRRFVLFGWSMGAGVAIDATSRLAGDARLAGVIAEAPYRHAITPARNMLRLRALPSGWNLRAALAMMRMSGSRVSRGSRPFDRAALAARIAVPMLVIHGELDEISPIEDGRAIAAATPRTRLIELAGASHYGLWSDLGVSERLARDVRDFVGSCMANS